MILGVDRERRCGGFTLIEMIVVLTILAVAIGLVVPLFGTRQTGVELNAATARVRAAMAEARATAIAEGRAVAFRGDRAGGFWLDNRHRGLDAGAERGLRVLTAGDAMISFFPSGGSSGGRVLVQTPYGRRNIAIDPVTGRAVVQP